MRLATVAVLTLLAAAPLAAQSDDVLFGVKAGIVELDCVDVEDVICIDTDLAPSGGVFLDYGLTDAVFGGLYADVHGVKGDFGDDREYMIDVGAMLKATFGSTMRRAYFRPGIGAGFGTLDVGETAQFLTTRATLEVVIPQVGGTSWLAEAGVYYAPLGSAGDADVTFGPGFMLRGGVLF